MNNLYPKEDVLIEITIDGHDLVVPEGTTISEAKIMVENAENAGTQNIPLEHWDYLNMLQAQLMEYELMTSVIIDQTPPIVVHDQTGKEFYTCETTTDLHKYIRTLKAGTKSNAGST